MIKLIRHWQRYYAWYILFLSSLVFLLPVLLRDELFYRQDFSRYTYGQKKMCVDTFLRGELFLWNPYQDCGFPGLANISTGYFDPFNLLLRIFPYHLGLKLFVGAYLFLAASGMYCWLRLWKLEKLAALTGAICFAFSGIRLSLGPNLPYFTSSAWMPFIFVSFHLAICRNSWNWLATTAILCTFALFSGDPQSLAATLGLLTVYLCFLNTTKSWRQTLLQALWLLPLLVLLVLCLGAIQILPTWEFLQNSTRHTGLSYVHATTWSLTPLQFLQLLCPALQGYPPQQWFGHIGHYLDFPFISTIFMGSWGLFLVCAGWWLPCHRLKWFALLSTLLTLLLAFGFYCPGFYWLWKYIPFFRIFRYPSKYLLYFAFGFATLVACHFQSLFYCWETFWPSARRKILVGLGLPLLAYGFLAILVLLPAHWKDMIPNETSLSSSAIPVVLAPNALSHVLQLAGLFLAIIGLWFWLIRSPATRLWLGGVIVLTMTWQLIVVGWLVNPTCPEKYYHQPSWGEKHLHTHLSQTGRYYSATLVPPHIVYEPALSIESDFANFEDVVALCTGTKAYAMGLSNVFSYTPGTLQRWEEFQRVYNMHQIFYLTGVEYLLIYKEDYTADFSQYSILDRYRQWLFCGKLASLGKAWFPDRVLLVQNLEASRSECKIFAKLNIMNAASIEASRTDQIAYPANAQSSVSLKCHESQKVVLTATSDRERWLILNDSFYPGWECRIDGKPVPIYPANLLFRAVLVPPGHSEICFTYHLASYYAGLRISCATLLLCGIVLLARCRHVATAKTGR
jgi:hypothetical protein